jgi:copper chaperone CopZ
MTTKTYSVPDISCGHCVATIERELKAVDGLQTVKANQDTKAVMVEVDDEGVLAQVEAMLVEIGYPPAGG